MCRKQGDQSTGADNQVGLDKGGDKKVGFGQNGQRH